VSVRDVVIAREVQRQQLSESANFDQNNNIASQWHIEKLDEEVYDAHQLLKLRKITMNAAIFDNNTIRIYITKNANIP
jgi:hypothetical protein